MQQFKNNAYGTITSTHAAGAASPLTITLTAGHGARFPAASTGSGTWFIAMLVKTPPNKIEFIKVTNRSTDTLTATRAWGGFAAQDWAPGDRIVHVADATTYSDLLDITQIRAHLAGGGTADVITATLVSAHTVLQNGAQVTVEASAANATTAPTLALTFDAAALGGTTTSTGAISIKKGLNRLLDVGDIPGANYPCQLRYASAWSAWVLLNPANGVSAVPVGTPVPTFSMSDTCEPGHVWGDGAAISRTTYADLFAKLILSQSGTTSGGASKIVTGLTSTTKMFPGMEVSGTNIVAGSRIKSLNGATQITLTKAASGAGTQTLTFYAHGAGDGSTTFNAPLLEGRSLVGSSAGSHTEYFDDLDVTVGTDAIAVGSNTEKWITGATVIFNILSGSIAGLSNGGTYYVIRQSTVSIKLATSLANAQNGVAIDITAVGGPSSFKITWTGSARKVGEVGGEEAHAMSISEFLAHTHNIGTGLTDIDQSRIGGGRNTLATNIATDANGGNAAMNTMQPYVTVRWMVKT